VKIYEQTGTTTALRDLVVSLDAMGDNKHALGFNDEARAYRLKALELFEQLVKLEPAVQEFDPYYRDKVTQNETEE
jgi:hypothetical protein